MSKVGFIGMGIMGRPMSLNLIRGGHELYVHSHGSALQELVAAGATRLRAATWKSPARRTSIITMVPDTPDVAAVAVRRERRRRRSHAGKIVVDMSSISPVETEAVRAEDQRARLPISRRAGVGRRSRSQGSEPDASWSADPKMRSTRSSRSSN